MKLIDRYIGREILITTLFAVGVLTFVLVLGNLMKEILDRVVNRGAPLELVLTVTAHIIPFVLVFTIPWGFLTAVLLVFGRLSNEHELTALRSGGLSVARICLPLLVLTLLSVGLCLWINVYIAPKAQQQTKAAFFNNVMENPLSMFGSDHVIDEFPNRKIYVEKKEGTVLKNILVYELDENSYPIRVMFAKKGQVEADMESKSVDFHIYDARFEQRDTSAPGDLGKINSGITMKDSVLSISLKDLYEKNKNSRKPPWMSLQELQQLHDDIKNNTSAPQGVKASLESAIRTEVNKRFSFSLASLALSLIAVPLAVTANRKETSIGFFFSIIIGFAYFFLIDIAVTLQNNPKWHPEILIWMSNVIFISLGGYLFWRLNRK